MVETVLVRNGGRHKYVGFCSPGYKPFVFLKTAVNDRPDPSSEEAPDIKNALTVKQYLTSGHEPQMGLDTKTD
jgi:hypothetical protein